MPVVRKWRTGFFSLVTLVLAGASAAPWVGYWVGLSKVEGRPVRAAREAATAEEVDSLFKRLRVSQPFYVDPMSPYSIFLQGNRPSDSARIAWLSIWMIVGTGTCLVQR